MTVFLKHGRTLFAIAIIAFGMENVICAQCKTAVIPVIPWAPATPFFAYLTGIGLLLAGVNLALNWKAHMSAVWSGIFFLVSVVLLRLPRLLAAPLDLGIRTETFETLALCGASFMLAGTLTAEKHYLLPWENAEDAAIRAGRFLFAGSCLVFGIDHLVMLDFIASLIPSWIPAPMFWASFTGFAFIGAGVCIATKRLADVAGTLLGIMFMLWFLLLHVPRILSSSAQAHDPNEWSSAFIALAMCGSAWICAWAASEKQFSTLQVLRSVTYVAPSPCDPASYYAADDPRKRLSSSGDPPASASLSCQASECTLEPKFSTEVPGSNGANYDPRGSGIGTSTWSEPWDRQPWAS